MPTLLHIDMSEQQEKEEKNYKNKTQVIYQQMKDGLLIYHLDTLEVTSNCKMMLLKMPRTPRKKNHLIPIMNDLFIDSILLMNLSLLQAISYYETDIINEKYNI
jgi:hypothetical protein